MLLVTDASPLSRIQAFSLRLHESAPSDSSLFSSAHFTGCSASQSCSEDPEQFIDIQQCTTRKRGGGVGGVGGFATGVHCTFLLWEFSVRCSALVALDLNLGLFILCQITPQGTVWQRSFEGQQTPRSTSKHIPQTFNENKYSHLPGGAMATQTRAEDATTATTQSKNQIKTCIY